MSDISKELVYKIGLGGLVNGEILTFDYASGEKLKPYLCHIVARDFKYMFKREFVDKIYDNFSITHDGRKMNCIKFKIQANQVYEYKRFPGLTHGEVEEGYFAIADNKVIELDYEEVKYWCGTVKEKARARSKGRMIFGDESKYAKDDIDF